MREKDKWALEYTEAVLKKKPQEEELTAEAVSKFGIEMFLVGFQLAKEKMMDLCDSKQQVVGFTEINRLGEKSLNVSR